MVPRAASHLILWELTQGTAKHGRRRMMYVAALRRDTGVPTTDDLKTCMMDKSNWGARKHVSRTAGGSD